MASPYGKAYGSPAPPAAGQAAAQLRHAVRKGYVECEAALMGWEEAHRSSLAVLSSLANAAGRLAEFMAARGELGVVSDTPGAETLLLVRLVQSMERLLGALRPTVSLLKEASDSVESVYERLLREQADAFDACSAEDLWHAAHAAQPSVGAMLEWLQDLVNALQREVALREQLLAGVGYEQDEGMGRALELWDAKVFFCREAWGERLQTVKIHCVL
mmetsp:Transcript_42488/g.83065  ORF Transcript_42488/g.83065 Transcript_42488/m.83065 type:complete len:217 (+) Transcript_42488:32-682(+)